MSTPEDPRAKFTRPLTRPGADRPERPGLTARANLPARVEPQREPPPEEAPPGNGGGLARLLEAVAKMLQPKSAAKDAAGARA